MAEDQRPIIVKRVKKGHGGHHGGAWKIAYADFVTAMMAFFLLMWLLSSTGKYDLKGIEQYFQTPLSVTLFGGAGSGQDSGILTGGGKSILDTREDEGKKQKKSPQKQQDVVEFEKKERKKLEEMQQQLQSMIDASATLQQYKNQILIDITSEGLRIQIVDEKNRPMFDLSGDQLKPYTREILRELGKFLGEQPNRLSLSGHTDAHQYASGEKGFSNWELSSNRANASRREMIAGGMAENKVLRVVGHSGTIMFDKNDPYNPVNRRISIVVLNKRTEESLMREGVEVEVNGQDKVELPQVPVKQ